MTSGDGVSLICVLQERVNRRLDDEKQVREQAVAALERRLVVELDRLSKTIERRLKEPANSDLERHIGDVMALETRLSTEIDRKTAQQTANTEQRLTDLVQKCTGELQIADDSCRKEISKVYTSTQQMVLKTMDAVQVALEGALTHLESRLSEELARISNVALRSENERSRHDMLQRELAQVKARCDQDRGLHDRAMQDLAYSLRAEFVQIPVRRDVLPADSNGSRLVTQATLEELESRLRLEIGQTFAEVCGASGDEVRVQESLHKCVQRLAHDQQVLLDCSRNTQRTMQESLEKLEGKFIKEIAGRAIAHPESSACCYSGANAQESSAGFQQEGIARFAADQRSVAGGAEKLSGGLCLGS